MRPQITEKKLLEIFIGCDDFCQHFESWAKENRPGVLQPIRGGLCSGEIMTILIAYHLSGYKNFEYFYREWVLVLHQNDFPGAMSYKRFLCYIRRVFDYMFVYLMWLLKNTFRSGTISWIAPKYRHVITSVGILIRSLTVSHKSVKQVPGGSTDLKST